MLINIKTPKPLAPHPLPHTQNEIYGLALPCTNFSRNLKDILLVKGIQHEPSLCHQTD